MQREILIAEHPDQLNTKWDDLAVWYYQKRAFLAFLHTYNYCNQRYYQLFVNNRLVAGTIVYHFRTNILTFSGLNLFVKTKIIGLPISIATVPIIGESGEHEFLLEEIIKREKLLILGLNFTSPYLKKKVVNMRTLPTIVIESDFDSYEAYLNGLRYPYRRRIIRFREKFEKVRSEVTPCSVFNRTHYKLYLDVMDSSTTKLETLSQELFENLPENFILITHYIEDTMLAWNICLHDRETLFFFMGGLNYEFRDRYKSYHNNLASVVELAFQKKCTRIDLGQTAEIAKLRMGGLEEERTMFIYHKNVFILLVMRFLRKILTYSSTRETYRVFKSVRQNI